MNYKLQLILTNLQPELEKKINSCTVWGENIFVEFPYFLPFSAFDIPQLIYAQLGRRSNVFEIRTALWDRDFIDVVLGVVRRTL